MTVRIGAYHADAWPGLVFSDRPGEGFAIRFAVERAGETADLDDFFWLLHEAGPHDPDGRYARVAFDTSPPFGLGADTPLPPHGGRAPGLLLEWARVGARAVVGRVRTGFHGTLLLRAWFPWDWTGRWLPGGEAAVLAVTESGAASVAVRWDGVEEAPEADAPIVAGSSYADAAARAGAHTRELRTAVSPGQAVCFTAVIASAAQSALAEAEAIDLRTVPETIARAAGSYETRRTRVTGALDDIAAAVTNTIHWMVLLQPETGSRYTPAGRRWIFPRAAEHGGGLDHWTVFGWDSFFNALELAVEAPAVARETLLAGLRSAYENGCVPNWRGRYGGTPDRSQPPIGALATVKLHLRQPDVPLLEEAYPMLCVWSRWWAADQSGRARRGAGPRGLFTWGSDHERIDPLAPPWERGADVRQRAAWESGQDDLPTWDEAEPAPILDCLAVDPVDLNAYRVLDLDCLGFIAETLGRDGDAAAHRREADALRVRVNEHLWDADRETYADRRWDGTFTPCRTASHFLVLAAGIAPEDRARRMVEHLTEPSLFWGDYVIPTISRDDARFPQQQYWRGTIWPPLNYLVHLGLARYGFDAVAGEVATRGARMFLDDRRRTGLCRENFDSRTGEGGGQRHQSWGPLFALAALEEMADVTPWDGLRVGGLRVPAESTLTNRRIGDRLLDVTVGPAGVRAGIDGRDIVESRGAVVLRRVVLEADRFAAETSAETPIALRIHLDGRRWSAVVDGQREEVEEPTLRLAPGRSAIEVRRIG